MGVLDNNFLVKAMTLDLKHWVEGFYFYNPDSNKHHIITAMVEGLSFNVEINPFTLCRCCGKYINDNLLFENDLILDTNYGIYKIEFGKNNYGCPDNMFPIILIGNHYTSDEIETNKLRKLINSNSEKVYILTDSIRNARGDLFSYLYNNKIEVKSQIYSSNTIEIENKIIRIFPGYDKRYHCGINLNKENSIFMNFSFRIKIGL